MRYDHRPLAGEVPGLRCVRLPRRGALEPATSQREGRRARSPRSSGRCVPTRPPASGPACPSSTAFSAAAWCRLRSCSSAASPASGSRPSCSPRSGTCPAAGRRAFLVTGEESVAQVKLRGDRLGGAEHVEILAETESTSVCATLERERPDDVYRLGADAAIRPSSARLPAPSGRCGRPARPSASRRSRESRSSSSATSRRTGPSPGRGYSSTSSTASSSSRATATTPPGPARSEEPIRLDERARRFEMTGGGLVGVPDHPSSSAHAMRVRWVLPWPVPSRARGRSCSRSRRSSRRTDLAMPRRVGTGVDPKRLAMIVAVLSRHAASHSGRPTCSSTWPAACGSTSRGRTSAVALAIASAARGVPVRGGSRRLRRDRAHRPLAPRGPGRASAGGVREARPCTRDRARGTAAGAGARVVRAETLRQAIAAGLERRRGGGTEVAAPEAEASRSASDAAFRVPASGRRTGLWPCPRRPTRPFVLAANLS